MKTRTLVYAALAIVGLALVGRASASTKPKQADTDAYGLPNRAGYETLTAPMSYLDKDALARVVSDNLAKLQTNTQTAAAPANSTQGSNKVQNAAAVASIVSSVASFFS